MWALGDYREVAKYLQPHAELLAVAADIQPGMEVLDVAAAFEARSGWRPICPPGIAQLITSDE